MLAGLLDEFRAWSWLELTAVGAAIAYLLLAIRQNILCWLFAALSTAIYVYLFMQAKLYMESVLNLFYLAMAFFGWWQWSSGSASDGFREVTRWPLRHHLLASVAITAIALANGYLLQAFSDAALPYIDSLTTWFAIWATFLVAKKILENWWYWLVIDIVSVFIYWSRDLPLTSLLFVVYVVMIPFGFISWRNSMRRPVS